MQAIGNNLSTQALISNKKNQKTNFGNAITPIVTSALRATDASKLIGANAVDLLSMVLPRTLIDFTRSKSMGIETARREFSSGANNSAAGLYGVGAGYLLSKAFSKKFDIPAHKIYADDETLDVMSKAWKSAVKNIEKPSKEEVKGFFSKVFDSVEGLTQNGWKKWKDVPENSIEKISKELADIATGSAGSLNLNKLKKEHILTNICSEMGAKNLVRFGDAKVETELASLVDNTYSLGKSFMKPKVAAQFDNFVSGLKKLGKSKTILGIAIGAAIGCSLQPVNAWITKKTNASKSGEAQNVEQKVDKSMKLKAMKVATMGAMGTYILGTLGGPNNLLKKLQFKGPLGTLDQLKVIYGLTIFGRFAACRDKNELRESATRDFLGYTNWMVLGGFVGEKVAKMLDKTGSLFNVAENGKKYLKSFDEIIEPALGKKVFGENGKRSMAKIAKELKETNPKVYKDLMRRNIAQVSGLVYSMITLGLIVPIVNKKITESIMAKQKNVQTSPNVQEMTNNIKNNMTETQKQIFSAFLTAK